MTKTTSTEQEHPGSIFARIVVGVDGSEPSIEACRQAARLADPDGSLELLSAIRLADAALAGYSSSRLADELQEEAAGALAAAKEAVGERASAEIVNGPPVESLRHELERRGATLVAVGTHGKSRASDILLGGVAGELLHNAVCSVLVARPPADPGSFPRAILAGLDGSPQAELALDVARKLADRFHASLRVVSARGGKDVDLERVRAVAPECEVIDGRPSEVLVGAAAAADLLVVGSRGLHGLRALGSVSERVAHRASSSVLVVRSPKR